MQDGDREAIRRSESRFSLAVFGEASEIARAYLFLMEEGYSMGQTVVVDAGGLLV
jgi:NAD(P)-dependent dehydrogenase (short-subunit alcohol dehydrogenase family)